MRDEMGIGTDLFGRALGSRVSGSPTGTDIERGIGTDTVVGIGSESP